MGGAVALETALTYPVVAQTLTLVCSAGLGRAVGPGPRLLSVPLLGEILALPSRRTTRQMIRGCVTKADLESPCRKRQFALPRQYAMFLSRQLTKCSYPQIGRMFGDRDHTTVLFAFRKISAAIAANDVMADELRQLEARILADPRNARP